MFCKSRFVPRFSMLFAECGLQNRLNKTNALGIIARHFKSLASTGSATPARLAFQGLLAFRQPMFCRIDPCVLQNVVPAPFLIPKDRMNG